MKVAFLQKTVSQSIGVRYLSSIIKSKGWEAELFVEPFEKDILNSLKRYSPNITGFGFVSGAQTWPLRLAQKVKKILPETMIVFGGPGPTFSPEIVYHPYVDAVAIGEAELSLPELIGRVECGKSFHEIPGLWIKKGNTVYRNELAPLVGDISKLPYPDYELYSKYKFYRTLTEAPFIVRRGCQFRCTFCSSSSLLYVNRSKHERARTAENVIAEMEVARAIYPKMHSIILYDTTGVDKKWLEDFTSVYPKRINIPWSTSSRADLINEALAQSLSRSGCFCVCLGVETGNEGMRMNVLGKRISNAQYLEAARILHKAGIKICTSNMLFLPGETATNALETVEFNRLMKADHTSALILQLYPGTAIYKHAVEAGYLSRESEYNNIDPTSLMEPMIRLKDFKKILVIHRLFYFFVKNTFIHKALKFLLLFPPNPIYNVMYYFSIMLNYMKYHRVNFIRTLCISLAAYGERNTRSA